MKSLFAPYQSGDTLSQLRNQIYQVINIGLFFLSLTTGLYYLLFAADSNDSQKLVIIFTSITCGVYAASLLAIKYTQQIVAVGHITMLWLSIIIFSMICITGGGLQTATITPMVLLIIGLGFCALGAGGGLFWASLVTASFFLVGLAQHNGITFPQLIVSSTSDINRLVLWVLTLLLLCLLFGAYEWILVKLSNEHGGNANKLLRQNKSSNLIAKPVNKSDYQNYITQAMQRNSHYNDMLALHLIDLSVNASNLQQDLILDGQQRIAPLCRNTDCIIRIDKGRLILISENIGSEACHQLVCSELEKRVLQPYFIEGFEVEFEAKLSSILYPLEANSDTELTSFLEK